MKIFKISTAFLALFLIIGCQKKKPESGNYIGNFWGEHVTMSDTSPHYELDLSLKISRNKKSLLINDNNLLHIVNDSIEGSMYFSDTYSIQPYLVGTWTCDNKKFIISGEYAAVKDVVTTIKGPFEIRQQ